MERATVSTKETPASANAMSLSPLQNRGAGLLQRKCACGGTPGPTGECAECSHRKRLGLQTKLAINQPGDAYEQEADRVAQIMMGSFSHPAEPKSDTVGQIHHPTESDLTHGGEQLAPNVAEFFQTRFGRDFSGVRVHTGETAMRYNDAVNAYAFTYGSHIWLGPGFRPQPSHILAHELAHVVQQTQPSPLYSVSGHTALSPTPHTVQRFAPYWMPEAYRVVGEESHAFILPKIGKRYKFFTEAPVPHAGKDGAAPGFEKQGGIADLYKASTTVDVFFSGKSLPKKLSSNPRLFSRLLYAGKSYAYERLSAPQAAEGDNVIRAARAPTEVLIGDLKPSHGTIEAAEGPEQVQGYLKGFQIAQDAVNEMDVGTGGYQQTDAKWPNLTTGIIKFDVPGEFKEPIAKGQSAQPLKLMYNGHRVELPRPVMGKVYVRPSPNGSGIWNYTWAPTTRLTTADLPESVTQLGANITARIIRPLLISPVTKAKKARPDPRPSRLAASPLQIQTKGRDTEPAEAKDPFDKTAFEAWKADHSRLTGEEKQLEKTPAFKEAQLISLIAEERQAAIDSRFDLPPVPKGQQKAGKTLSKIQFWTGASSAIFGRLRYWFGGAFVKIYNAYHAIRARFQKSLEQREDSPKSGGLVGTIVRIAFKVLKILGRILVERTAQHLVTSLKTGVTTKLKSLIPEDKFEEFEAKIKEVEELATYLENQVFAALEGLVEKTIGPYEQHIATIIEWASKISDLVNIVNKVKWGARVIACLSPPGWGCLWILAQSVLEKFASWLIDRCWFKKEVAPLITGVEFIAKLPGKLAAFIIDEIKILLPDTLHDVFADIDTSKISMNFAPYEICNENDYPTTRDRDLLERLALDELRHDIGEAKWEAWTKLAKLYGTNLGAPLTVEQIEELKKELVRADLNAMKEAADLYPAFVPTEGKKAVINLTTFLEEAGQVKQQMYGGGGPGGEGGGEVGISVGPSQRPVEGSGRPSPHRWEIVSGIGRGQFKGAVIKVDLAASINGVTVKLENVEVVITNRALLPNKKWVFDLEITKDQAHDFSQKYDTATLKRIGFAWHRYKAGTKLAPYTLQLNGG